MPPPCDCRHVSGGWGQGKPRTFLARFDPRQIGPRLRSGPPRFPTASSCLTAHKTLHANRWRSICATSRPSGSESQHETPTAKAPKSRPASLTSSASAPASISNHLSSDKAARIRVKPPDFDRALLPKCILPRNAQNRDSPKSLILLVHPSRFEREASAFGGQRSIQLSYGCRPEAGA